MTPSRRFLPAVMRLKLIVAIAGCLVLAITATAMYRQKRVSESAAENESAVWDMGMIYPGFPYETLFPVDNGCRIGTEATIAYPNPPIPIDGLKIVPLAPYEHRKVHMTLQYPRDQVSSPDPFCTLHAGTLTAIHEGVLDHGTNFEYICSGAKREYKIILCLYHGPGGGDSGSGKPKPIQKKTGGPPGLQLLSASPCETFWNSSVFAPSKDAKTPEYCLDYFRQMAHQLFDEFLKTNRAANPQQWAWVPTGAAIDSLSIDQILDLRKQIVAALLKSGA
jgi:hypothetical protein